MSFGQEEYTEELVVAGCIYFAGVIPASRFGFI